MTNSDDEHYVLRIRDRSIVLAAKDLLWKVVRSPFVTSEQVEIVAKVLHVLERLPEISDELNVSVQLTGPHRWYGEHRIRHWWEVQIEGQLIEICSAGYFYRQSTGGDSFACIQWSASPGYEAELDDHLDSLGIVDDAMPFEPEVAQIDLNEAGYSVTVYVDGEESGQQEDTADDFDETRVIKRFARGKTSHDVYPCAGEERTLRSNLQQHSMRSNMTKEPPQDTTEIILNLWYVRDEAGVIYSLRVRTYACSGSDEQKLSFLQERAQWDYLVADPFEIPERFHLTIGVGTGGQRMPVAHISMLDTLDSPVALFEDAIRILESRLPAQTTLPIPQDPLVCITPLMQNEKGAIEPRVTGQYRL